MQQLRRSKDKNCHLYQDNLQFARRQLEAARQRLESAKLDIREAEAYRGAAFDQLAAAPQDPIAQERLRAERQSLDDAEERWQHANKSVCSEEEQVEMAYNLARLEADRDRERQQQYEKDMAEAKAAAKKLEDAQMHELRMLERLNDQQRHLSALQNQVLRNDTAPLSEDLQQVVNRRRVNSSREAQRETDYLINLFCQFVDWRNRYREHNPLPDTERQEVEFFLFLCQEPFELHPSIRGLLALQRMAAFHRSLAERKAAEAGSPDRSILAASAAQSSAQQPHAVQDSSAEIVTDGAAAQLAAHWETGEMDLSAPEEPVTPGEQDVATGGGEQESPMDIDDVAKASHASVFAASGPHHARDATSHGPPPQQARGAVDNSTDVVMDIPSSLLQPATEIVVIVKYLYGDKKEFHVDSTKTVADLLTMIASDSAGRDWIKCIGERDKNRPALYTADTWHDGGGPFAADTAVGSIACADHTKALDLQLSVMTPAHSLRDVLMHLGSATGGTSDSPMGDNASQGSAADGGSEGSLAEDENQSQAGSSDAGQQTIDLLSFTKVQVERHDAIAILQPGAFGTTHAAAGTSAIAGGTGNASAGTLLGRVNGMISTASRVATPAADDAMHVLSVMLSAEDDRTNEAANRADVKVLLEATALLLGQTSGVVEQKWLRDRGHNCDLGFVFTTRTGAQMIFAIKVDGEQLFDHSNPLHISHDGTFVHGGASGAWRSCNQAFTCMVESGLDVSVLTNITQTIVLQSRIDSSQQLATTFSCFEDPSSQALLVLLYTLLHEVRTRAHGQSERNFVQHDLDVEASTSEAVQDGWFTARDRVLSIAGEPLWMARSVDPAAAPGCLRMREVPSLAAVPQELFCQTADDALRLEPGIKPLDIIVGAQIGAGRFGVVREALFQGKPAAVKRIVLHLYKHNQELYRHEVHMYLRLCCLWGVAVATLLSCGMDCHDSVSIITERGSHSETWPESDVELAVASLKEIHRMGILHGDVHAKNVVFVVKDNERRALWIDFERSEFSSDTHKQRKEISQLRKCAASIRQKFESE
ncbi:Calmodulin-dependent protein kinase cmk2 [Polyrhizophydium stewartii]|uniref:Calmodulin-dependent protein kinase cmk2 n=1 Tax=Polyrhizophydium stewartii TaxID=2732419 RepID=A0ABR4NEP2_9FUNG